MAKEITKLASGKWFFEWDCGACMDSGIVLGLLGPVQCAVCKASLGSVSFKVFGALSLLHLKEQPAEGRILTMARVMVSATSTAPIPGEALAFLLETDLRWVKQIAKTLRDDWHLPVCGRREQPTGYFIAATIEEYLAWSRTTRAQAISELATEYRLGRHIYPEFYGQKDLLDFVNTVTTELQEAIR